MGRYTRLFNPAAVPITGPGSGSGTVIQTVAWTGDARTWPFDTQTGPQTNPSINMTSPIFRYPTTGGPLPALGTRGNIVGYNVSPITVWDPNLLSQKNDSAGAVNIENWPINVSQSIISSAGLRYSSYGSTGSGFPVTVDHCTFDNTQTAAAQQGLIYKLCIELSYCRGFAFQDGFWIGDTTRNIVFKRYAGGDFSDPYGSKVKYCWWSQTNTSYGQNTWHPDQFNSGTGTSTNQTVNFSTVISSTASFIVSSGTQVTTPTVHGLSVGQKIQFATVIGITGILAATTYYIASVPNTTSMTIAATSGGTAIVFTAVAAGKNGSATNVTLQGEPSSGSWFLEWNGGTSNLLTYTATAAQVTTAIMAIPALASQNSFTVTGSMSNGFVITVPNSISPLYQFKAGNQSLGFIVASTLKSTTILMGPALNSYAPDPRLVYDGIAAPVSHAQTLNAVVSSVSTPTTAHVGDFVLPDPNVDGANTGSGVFGGIYQVIGSIGTDRSKTAAITIGTDYQVYSINADGSPLLDSKGNKVINAVASWPQGTTLLAPFVSGTAVMAYLGGSNHSDATQMSTANGHIWWYRSRLENFGNSAVFICQPTSAPQNGGDVYDPSLWSTSYLRVEECRILLQPNRSRIAYVQGSSQTDPYSGLLQYPAYGYKGAPKWVTFKNNYMGNTDGTPVSPGKKLYYNSSGLTNLVVASEARRFDGVMAQMTSAGNSAMSSANGGSLPNGTTIAASNTLRAKLIQLEYQDYLSMQSGAQPPYINMPTDGYSGTADNITNNSVFQARLAAKISKSYLDARTWVVWENNMDDATGNVLTPDIPSAYLSKSPWLAQDGTDHGYYKGTA